MYKVTFTCYIDTNNPDRAESIAAQSIVEGKRDGADTIITEITRVSDDVIIRVEP